MANNTISGNQGTMYYDGTLVGNLSEWSITIDQAINKTVVPTSSPFTITSRGNTDITGTMRVKIGDTTFRIESVAFTPTASVTATTGLVTLRLVSYSGAEWSGSARMGRITQGANVESGANQEVNVEFSGHGTWTIT